MEKIYKKTILFTFFVFVVFSSKAQLIAHSSTIACSGYEDEDKFNIFATIGETLTGQKIVNNFIFIEGFYSTIDFYSKIKIHNANNFRFLIYPIPTDNYFYVKNQYSVDVFLTIYNLSGVIFGKYILQSNAIITVNSLPKGSYLLKFNEKAGNLIEISKQIIL